MFLWIIIIALSPIAMLIGMMLFPIFLNRYYRDEDNYHYNYYDDDDDHKNHFFSCKGLLLFLIGIIIFPLTLICSVVAAIIPGICLLGKFIIEWCGIWNENSRQRSISRKERRELIRIHDEAQINASNASKTSNASNASHASNNLSLTLNDDF